MRILENGLLFGKIPNTQGAGPLLNPGTMEYALSQTVAGFGRSCESQTSTYRLGEMDANIISSRFPGLFSSCDNTAPENREKYFSSLFPKCMQSTSKPEMKELASGLAAVLAQGEVLRVIKITRRSTPGN